MDIFNWVLIGIACLPLVVVAIVAIDMHNVTKDVRPLLKDDSDSKNS